MKRAVILIASLLLFCSPEIVMNDSGRTSMKSLNLRPQSVDSLIWGQKISAEDCAVVRQVAIAILADANDMMACMAWEGNKEFSPKTKNFAGSSGTGMIQVMIDTVKYTPEIFRHCQGKMNPDFVSSTALDHQIEKAMEIIAGMTFSEYMYHVVKPYFWPYRGRIGNLPDLYMAILRPLSIGKPMNSVMFVNDLNRHKDTYDMNNGLDANKDNVITKAEACAPVMRMYEEGKSYLR